MLCYDNFYFAAWQDVQLQQIPAAMGVLFEQILLWSLTLEDMLACWTTFFSK